MDSDFDLDESQWNDPVEGGGEEEERKKRKRKQWIKAYKPKVRCL